MRLHPVVVHSLVVLAVAGCSGNALTSARDRTWGGELIEIPAFKNVDLVIPVPLHPKKKRKRGFNQAEMIALGICKSLERPMLTNALIRTEHTATQTNKSRFDRWDNVGDVFKVNAPNKIEHKKVLLVDDVMTTGATIGS